MPVDPSSLSGKALWLRAKDLTAGAVTSWPDQSGGARNATAAGTSPTAVAASTPNGGKSVRFAGAGYFDLPGLAAAMRPTRGVCTASSQFGTDYNPSNAVDGVTTITTGNTWASGAVPAWWQIQLPAAEVITTYRFMSAAQSPRDWTWQGSNDGTTWTVLDTRAGQTPNNNATAWNTYTFTNATAYAYYRLNVTAVNGASIVNVTEIELGGVSNGIAGYDIWAVVKSDGAAAPSYNGHWLLGSETTSFSSYYAYLGSNTDVYEGAGLADPNVGHYTATMPVNAWRLLRVTYDGATWKAYLDGVQQKSVAAPAIGFSSTARIGRNKAGYNFYGNFAELLLRAKASSTAETADLITYFNTEHGLTVPGGSISTPTTTVALPVSTGLSLSARTVARATVGLAASAGLAFTAAPVARTTVALPTSAGLGFTARTVQAGITTVALPASAGLGFTARTSARSSVALPVAAGLSFAASTIEGVKATTVALPVAAGLSFTATGGKPTEQLAPWTADVPGRTGLTLVTGDVALEYTPPLAPPPPGVVERTLTRRSVIVPALHTIEGRIVDPVTNAIRIPDDVYDALPVIKEDLGTIHVTIDAGSTGMNEDVTYWRDGLTLPISDVMEEPFGDSAARFEFPRITSLDEQPTGPTHPLWWQINRANIKLVLKRPDGTLHYLWSGVLVSDDTGNDDAPIKARDAIGALWQGDYDVRQVPNKLDPTDIGSLIANALNQVASRNYPAIPAVTTGIVSRQRGTWSQSQIAYVQGLLATAWTETGRQWTVAKVPNTRRSYEIRLKSTAPKWTITNGARGVKVNLSRDITQGRNVVYGRGVAPDGYAWFNTKYPGMHRDEAPPWPGTLMGLGATGAGVTLWQQRARELGYTIPLDGTISAADVDIIKAVQRKYGVQVDGVIGPQTWAATFGVGSNVGDLGAVVRLPLAADPATQKWLYNADGSIAGENPAYDPDVMVVSDDVDFGSGITRAEGIVSAQQIVDREATPSLTGQITLQTDPREGSRLFIDAGDKLTLVGYEQVDRVLHVTRRERNWRDLTVTLDVDERSRDALTLAQIRQRNAESRRDPARKPGRADRRSALDLDQVVPFDGESGAGIIPRHAIFGGLWTVIRIPLSQLGKVVKLDVTTSGPASTFALAMFGAPIQPSHLVKYVGDPLASDDPFGAHADTLINSFGFIEGWGQQGQAAGYYPGEEGKTAVTGRLVDAGGFEYVSQQEPWIWVAEWSPVTTWISGRIYPAPVE